MAKKGGLAALAATLARDKQQQQLNEKRLRSQGKGGSQQGVNKNKGRGDVKSKNAKRGESSVKQKEEDKEEEEEKKEEDEDEKGIEDENAEDSGDEEKHDENEGDSKNSDTNPHSSRKSFLPFSPTDKVLLIGEGDFSFAKSILENGLAKYVRPTNLDTKALLVDKYPDVAAQNIEYLEKFEIQNDEKESAEGDKDDEEEEEEDDDIKYDYRAHLLHSTAQEGLDLKKETEEKEWSTEPMYNVDATQLHKNKKLKAQGPFDVIVFNFPHTGSGIKDQTRNVVSHQKLMLAFFESCLGGPPGSVPQHSTAKDVLNKDTGTVVVTLFDGAPYSLWDIKSLAKQSRLTLRQSAQFAWDSFPGYVHRLTGGRGDTTKAADSRAARTYVFERRDARAVKRRLKAMEEKRAQNKLMTAISNNLKGKKGKRKLAQIVKRQKNGGKV